MRRLWTTKQGAVLATLLASAAAVLAGCLEPGPSGVLAVGEEAPQISAEGWLNGDPPENIEGKVVVVEAWAYW